MAKPILLHLGDDVRWNHELYGQLQQEFDIRRSYSMNRAEFKKALETKQFGDFAAMYRPFWNTGGEMGNWDDELISLLPSSCKIYASAGAGFDWVDTKRLADSGIIYCNSATACTESVADAAIWLILSTFRGFTESALAARSLDVDRYNYCHKTLPSRTHNPSGHTLGIIGLGKIGYRIAWKAHHAFNMKILYNDVVQMPVEVEKKVEAEYLPNLDDMLAAADCVVIAAPFSGKKVLNAEKMAKMKPGSRLVNIARGKLIDEEALVAALNSGHITAAGLDVHYDEPHVNPTLAQMENVELLTHIAGASVESHVGFERIGMENILSYFGTGKAINPVNLQWMGSSKY